MLKIFRKELLVKSNKNIETKFSCPNSALYPTYTKFCSIRLINFSVEFTYLNLVDGPFGHPQAPLIHDTPFLRPILWHLTIFPISYTFPGQIQCPPVPNKSSQQFSSLHLEALSELSLLHIQYLNLVDDSPHTCQQFWLFLPNRRSSMHFQEQQSISEPPEISITCHSCRFSQIEYHVVVTRQ